MNRAAIIGSLAFLGATLAAQPTLKDAFGGSFMIGAALNPAQVQEVDAKGSALVKQHFNSITPENVLKWEKVHPLPGTYDFEPSDRFVEYGEKNGMFIVGHTLVWHSQTPAWVFEDASGNPADRATVLERMRDHILTVVGRYKGRVKGWDVVNEALEEDGTLRKSPWLSIIGEDYILRAFLFAREADPGAELYYNDFSLENEPKRNGAVAIVQKLQASGIRVAGAGTQGHYKMQWPTASQITETIDAFAAIDVPLMITELDVDMLPNADAYQGADVSFRVEGRTELNPYPDGLPDSVEQSLANRYASLFGAFLGGRKHVSRVTFWGVTDRDSWLNNWPVRGRTSYPLLFGRDGGAKPAFQAVTNVARKVFNESPRTK